MPDHQASESEYLTTVGRLVNMASVADALMHESFVMLSGCTPAIAKAIYYSVDSFNARRNMMQRILEVSGDEEDSRLINALVASTKAVNTKRNELAHAVLCTQNPDTKPELIRVNIKNQKKSEQVITKRYLRTLDSYALRRLIQMQETFESFCEKRKVPPSLHF